MVGLILGVRRSGYDYGAAGLVAGAYSAGVGLVAPIHGRLADRYGQRPVLVATAGAYLALLGVTSAAVMSAAATGWVMAGALVAGAANPPLAACARIAWRKRYGLELREAAFSLDAVTIELGFIIGPLLAVALVEGLGSMAGVVGAGLAAFLGAGGFAMTPESAAVEPRRAAVGSAGALRSVGVRWLLLLFGLVSILFGVVDIVAPATAEAVGRPSATGALLAAFAAGSMLGGVVYGLREWPGTLILRAKLLLTGFGSLLLLAPLASGSLVGLGFALFGAGLTLAPLAIVVFQLVDEVALDGTLTEALAWTTSSNVAGAALGAVLAGFAVDRGAERIALGIGAVAVLAAAGIAWVLSDRFTSSLPASAS